MYTVIICKVSLSSYLPVILRYTGRFN